MKKCIFTGIFFLLAAARTYADTVGAPSTSTSTAQEPASMVANIYQFALIVAGILAFGQIVYAGIQFTISAGNPSKQSDAKDRITQALLGLLLLFGAVLILRTINPKITGGTNPEISGTTTPAPTGNCSPACVSPKQCITTDGQHWGCQ